MKNNRRKIIVLGQFGEYNIRILHRNNGLLLRSLYMEKERMEVCQLGT